MPEAWIEAIDARSAEERDDGESPADEEFDAVLEVEPESDEDTSTAHSDIWMAERLAEVTDRTGDQVPQSGSAQGTNEVGKAMAALGCEG